MAANHCRKASRSAAESRCRNAGVRSALAASGGPGCGLRLPAEIPIVPASTIMQTHQSFVLVLVILFTEFRATIKAVHTPEIKSCFKRVTKVQFAGHAELQLWRAATKAGQPQRGRAAIKGKTLQRRGKE